MTAPDRFMLVSSDWVDPIELIHWFRAEFPRALSQLQRCEMLVMLRNASILHLTPVKAKPRASSLLTRKWESPSIPHNPRESQRIPENPRESQRIPPTSAKRETSVNRCGWTDGTRWSIICWIRIIQRMGRWRCWISWVIGSGSKQDRQTDRLFCCWCFEFLPATWKQWQ